MIKPNSLPQKIPCVSLSRSLVLPAVFAFFLQSCAAVPFATSHFIEDKIQSLPPKASKEEVAATLGRPLFLFSSNRFHDKMEMMGYEFGNYWYHESRVFVFRNDRLVGNSETQQDLLKLLYDMQFLKKGEMFEMQEKK